MVSNKDAIELDLRKELLDGKIITLYAANKKTRCIEARLNDIYSNKTIVSRIYPDWIKTLDSLRVRAKNKGISDEHILMLTDTLDDNYQRILAFVFEDDEVKNGVNLLGLVNEKIVELFLDETKTPYAAIRVNEHVETIAIGGKKFEDWAGSLYYHYKKDYDTVPSLPSEGEIKGIQSMLRYEANSSSVVDNNSSNANQNVKQLNLRVAAFVETDISTDFDNNVIFYDLCNIGWEIVKITKQGWEIIKHDEDNLLFKRFPVMNAQVYPKKDYPPDILEQLMALTNLSDDEDNKLLAVVYIISLFLLASLPKPMLNPNGPHGSGKSTYQEFVKLIVDPAAALTTAFPNDLKELVQILSHSYVTFFDNVSEISRVTSDQLCRAVTGSGFVKRALYENDEDFIYNMKRAVGYNGINVTAHRADLLDRLLNLKLKHIHKRKRKKLKQLHKEFERVLPYFLGFAFDTLVKVLNRIGEVKLEELPRMADFAEMGELISRCLGYQDGKFIDAYNRNIGQTNEEVIDANLVATGIKILMNKQRICSGKAGEMLAKFGELAAKNYELQNLVNNRWRPKTPRAFSNRVTEVEPNLKEIGIRIERMEDKHSKSDILLFVNENYSSEVSETNDEDSLR